MRRPKVDRHDEHDPYLATMSVDVARDDADHRWVLIRFPGGHFVVNAPQARQVAAALLNAADEAES